MKGQTNKNVLRHKTQRKLRNAMTPSELKLWHHLRHRQIDGAKFRRQHPFRDFILDFVCLEQKLVIEVDGGQHAENKSADDDRTTTLKAAGYRLLRFWNNEVMENIEGVTETILRAVREAS